MRILFVLHRSPEGVPGGSELHTLDLIAYLGPRVRAFLFYPDDGRVWLRDARSGTRDAVAYAPPTSPFIGFHAEIEQFFAGALVQHDIELVHFQHLLNLPTSLGAVTATHQVPYAITLHDYFFWCVNYNLLRDLQFCWFETDLATCRRCLISRGVNAEPAAISEHRQRMLAVMQSADAIFCSSDFVRRSLQSLHPEIVPSRIHAIEMGSPVTPRLTKGPRPPGPLRVAFLGAFVPSKGSHYFTDLVTACNACDSITFFVVGLSPFSPDDQLPSYPNVQWIGRYAREDLAQILHDYSIDLALLLSPWAETFSYTLSEAILSGVPVIATDLGALRERVSRHGVGFLVEAEDPVPRVVRLLQDLAAHPETLEPFRQRCLEAAKHLQIPTVMASLHLEIYKQIVERHDGRRPRGLPGATKGGGSSPRK